MNYTSEFCQVRRRCRCSSATETRACRPRPAQCCSKRPKNQKSLTVFKLLQRLGGLHSFSRQVSCRKCPLHFSSLPLNGRLQLECRRCKGDKACLQAPSMLCRCEDVLPKQASAASESKDIAVAERAGLSEKPRARSCCATEAL